MNQAGPMFLACEGLFGCDCLSRKKAYLNRMKNLTGHGTRSKYNSGCRCIPCRRGNAKAMREYRAKQKEKN